MKHNITASINRRRKRLTMRVRPIVYALILRHLLLVDFSPLMNQLINNYSEFNFTRSALYAFLSFNDFFLTILAYNTKY
jgi:hypothetical protein